MDFYKQRNLCHIAMKPLLYILPLLMLCGCALVPTDGWPKATWYWSYEAKEHRKAVADEKAWQAEPQTNSVTK